MLFWWLAIGFVVWTVAVGIEVIWFWAPAEEQESLPNSFSEDSAAGPKDAPFLKGEEADAASSGKSAAEMTKVGG